MNTANIRDTKSADMSIRMKMATGMAAIATAMKKARKAACAASYC